MACLQWRLDEPRPLRRCPGKVAIQGRKRSRRAAASSTIAGSARTPRAPARRPVAAGTRSGALPGPGARPADLRGEFRRAGARAGGGMRGRR
ncbi:hypothetical protein QJS66_13235 [Kocuria rhizophila]|nr:hypothetical protein QJS66_13235 [Kocuria rhizophila]